MKFSINPFLDDKALLWMEEGRVLRDIGKWMNIGSFYVKIERWEDESIVSLSLILVTMVGLRFLIYL